MLWDESRVGWRGWRVWTLDSRCAVCAAQSPESSIADHVNQRSMLFNSQQSFGTGLRRTGIASGGRVVHCIVVADEASAGRTRVKSRKERRPLHSKR